MRKEFINFLAKWQPITLFFLCIAIFGILFLNYFPLVLVYLSTPKGMVFLGQASFFEPVDTNVYVSAIHYGQWGGILLPNLYTSIPNSPIFIYSFLTIVGFIFRSVNPFLLFYLYGFLTAIFLIIGLVFIINKLGFSIKVSLFSTVVICLGGGFGFINFSNIVPADLNYMHPTFFLTLQKPHEAIAVLSYIFSIVYLYFFILKKKRLRVKNILPILSPLLLVSFIYPFFVISFFLISTIYLALYRKTTLPKKDILLFVILLICSGLVVGFMYLQMVINPTFAGIATHVSVNIVSEILGFGILIPFFILQLFWLPTSPLKIFLSVWFVVIFLLAILPFGPGAVFLRGSFFPIVLLAVMTLQKLSCQIRPVLSYMLFFCFFLLLTATSARIFYLRVTDDYKVNLYVYALKQQYSIFSFLNSHTAPKSSVLSLYILGNQIPTMTRNTVYVGHGFQTPQALSKLGQAERFYLGEESTLEAKKFLKENNISYVVWGIEEKWLYLTRTKKKNNLHNIFSQLHIVYSNNGVAVFAVNE